MIPAMHWVKLWDSLANRAEHEALIATTGASINTTMGNADGARGRISLSNRRLSIARRARVRSLEAHRRYLGMETTV